MTTSTPSHVQGQKGSTTTAQQVLRALMGLFAGLFAAILSSTIVTTALPTIITDLNGSQTDFAWVMTAALLAGAVTTPIWGKLADLFDKKLLVQLSIVLFVAGSTIAGLAHNISVLLTGRAIQGIAMGGLTALSMAVIGAMVAPRERGRYSGYLGAVIAAATAGGPVLGGLIVDSPLGWRWTFFVVVPLAAAALVLLQMTLKIPYNPRRVSIDWLGAVLLTAGVSTFLIWTSFAGKEDTFAWVSWQSGLMVAASALLLGILFVVETRAAEPIIPLKIITERTTALAIVASIAVGVAMLASATYLGQYFQVSRGATATEAGLLMLPMIFGNLMGSVFSGQMITRFGRWKRFLVAGAILLVVGSGLAGTIDHRTELWTVGVYLFLFGAGLGLLMQNLVLAVQNTVTLKDVGSASAAIAFFRTIGGAVGVAVLGSILATRTARTTTEGLRDARIPDDSLTSTPGSSDRDLTPALSEIVRFAFGSGTALIFLIISGIATLALISILLIKEQALRETVDISPTPAERVSTSDSFSAPSAAHFSKVLPQPPTTAAPCTNSWDTPTTAATTAPTKTAVSSPTPWKPGAGDSPTSSARERSTSTASAAKASTP
ncbi:EmrB/QacA subfamily drug resistance transporter [Arthrobacter pascens]|uniref:MFS transporter n=1 Tax=Arthrobacter pascens TaxID=1677 RepID=UPI002790D296|nr:MFS transporter [Arthrobacter pascens]MDQ0678938.1 EmrB/QacA subfamily drug resistance transporter [Arthrobacter pascens]